MKKRLLILLASLLLLSISYYVLIYNHSIFLQKTFLDIDDSEVVSLVIFIGEKPYCFVKENHKWKSVRPYEKSADQWSFESFLKVLTMLPITQRISNNPDASELFGLGTPEIRIRITYGPDKKNTWVFLGNDNEAKTSTYAKIGGSNEIVLLEKVLKDDVMYIIEMIDAEDNDG